MRCTIAALIAPIDRVKVVTDPPRHRLGDRQPGEQVAGTRRCSPLTSAGTTTAPAPGTAAAADDDVLELLGVALLDVPPPPRAVGAVHPGLRLFGVATDRVVYPGGLQARVRQAGLGRHHLIGGFGLDAKVVD